MVHMTHEDMTEDFHPNRHDHFPAAVQVLVWELADFVAPLVELVCDYLPASADR
jgi:hypothetical protein